MRRLSQIMFLSAVLAVLARGAASEAAITYNAQNRPTSISSLTIAGGVYNLAIDYGGSFDSRYGSFSSPSPVPTFWQNEPGALQAVAAIAGALNAQSTRPLVNTTLVVPTTSGTWFFGDYVDGVVVDYAVGDSLYAPSTPLEGVRLDPHVVDDQLGWPTFTLVPEPSGGVLLAMSAAVLAACRQLRPLGRLRSTSPYV